jgi:hypothetical protein
VLDLESGLVPGNVRMSTRSIVGCFACHSPTVCMLASSSATVVATVRNGPIIATNREEYNCSTF